MNALLIGGFIEALKQDRKIEAIKSLRDAVNDETGVVMGLKVSKDFVEAVQALLHKPEPTSNKLPPYRFAVVFRSFNGEHNYESHLSEAEALNRAAEVLANPDFDIDYCHVVEIKHCARAKSVYTMKPYNDSF